MRVPPRLASVGVSVIDDRATRNTPLRSLCAPYASIVPDATYATHCKAQKVPRLAMSEPERWSTKSSASQADKAELRPTHHNVPDVGVSPDELAVVRAAMNTVRRASFQSKSLASFLTREGAKRLEGLLGAYRDLCNILKVTLGDTEYRENYPVSDLKPVLRDMIPDYALDALPSLRLERLPRQGFLVIPFMVSGSARFAANPTTWECNMRTYTFSTRLRDVVSDLRRHFADVLADVAGLHAEVQNMGGLEPVAQGKAWRSFAAQARMLFVGLHKYACFVERALFAEAQHFVKEASRPLRVLGRCAAAREEDVAFGAFHEAALLAELRVFLLQLTDGKHGQRFRAGLVQKARSILISATQYQYIHDLSEKFMMKFDAVIDDCVKWHRLPENQKVLHIHEFPTLLENAVALDKMWYECEAGLDQRSLDLIGALLKFMKEELSQVLRAEFARSVQRKKYDRLWHERIPALFYLHDLHKEFSVFRDLFESDLPEDQLILVQLRKEIGTDQRKVKQLKHRIVSGEELKGKEAEYLTVVERQIYQAVKNLAMTTAPYRRGSLAGPTTIADTPMFNHVRKQRPSIQSLSALGLKQDPGFSSNDDRVPVNATQQELWESLCTIAVEVSPELFRDPTRTSGADAPGGAEGLGPGGGGAAAERGAAGPRGGAARRSLVDTVRLSAIGKRQSVVFGGGAPGPARRRSSFVLPDEDEDGLRPVNAGSGAFRFERRWSKEHRWTSGTTTSPTPDANGESDSSESDFGLDPNGNPVMPKTEKDINKTLKRFSRALSQGRKSAQLA